MHHCPVLGLVPGPGDVLGVGLVVLGVSVPMPPAAPELVPDDEDPDVDPGLIPEELPPDSAGMEELPLPDGLPVPVEDPPDMPELLPDCPPLSEGMEEPPDEELPFELEPEVPLPLLPEPGVPPPEPPPVMPEHATISIAQATDINHLVIDHAR